MSVLPITKETIRYGTMDAGATIHAEDDTLLESLKSTAKKLNVKPVRIRFLKVLNLYVVVLCVMVVIDYAHWSFVH